MYKKNTIGRRGEKLQIRKSVSVNKAVQKNYRFLTFRYLDTEVPRKIYTMVRLFHRKIR